MLCWFSCVLITIGLGIFCSSIILTYFDNESFIMKRLTSHEWRVDTLQNQAEVFLSRILWVWDLFPFYEFLSVLKLQSIFGFLGYHLWVQKYLRFFLQFAWHVLLKLNQTVDTIVKGCIHCQFNNVVQLVKTSRHISIWCCQALHVIVLVC